MTSICATIRITDAMTLHKNRTLLILLPDTNGRGAFHTCKRIISSVIQLPASRMKLTPDNFHIKVLSFPESKATAADEKKPAADDAEISSTKTVAEKLPFKTAYCEFLRLSTSSYNGSSFPMRTDDIFFWDQQLFSNYLSRGKKWIKRIMDIVGASAAIILLLPMMSLIAVVVKVTSPGPVLFSQRRVGYKGKPFTFIKFRSMHKKNNDAIHRDFVRKLINGENVQVKAGAEDDPFFKIVDDPRTTRVGRFLRKTSLDELPQFFNVLTGAMSLVGPRPPIPYEVNEYKNWHLRRISEVKPGITGLWQVSGRSQTSFNDMVRLDIKYAENWSLMMDMKILLQTVKVVLAAKGK
ncbi:exopolysaccharide biosynthesis polyprenyl glycosylphosphotransferase [candidate division KSB1 bacterium]|nr:MAG: exopolysaccharide biosynthesis polyprenyl glycosylphosphotransferase [candidate division KSB1 bacterium]